MAASAVSAAADPSSANGRQVAANPEVRSTGSMTASHTPPVASITTSSTRSGRFGQSGPCTGVSCQAPVSVGAPVPSTRCHSGSTAVRVSVTASAESAPWATPNRTAASPEPGGAGARTGPGGRPFVGVPAGAARSGSFCQATSAVGTSESAVRLMPAVYSPPSCAAATTRSWPGVEVSTAAALASRSRLPAESAAWSTSQRRLPSERNASACRSPLRPTPYPRTAVDSAAAAISSVAGDESTIEMCTVAVAPCLDSASGAARANVSNRSGSGPNGKNRDVVESGVPL